MKEQEPIRVGNLARKGKPQSYIVGKVVTKMTNQKDLEKSYEVVEIFIMKKKRHLTGYTRIKA